MALPDGTVYRALVTSTPVIVDGKVMGALSVWHDFDASIRTPLSPPGPPGGPRGAMMSVLWTGRLEFDRRSH